MSTAEDKSARYTIDITTAAREQLSELAKRYKLTQGEVIEVLTGFAHLTLPADATLDRKLKEKRENKVAARKAVSQLKNLPPEQLAALLAQAKA